MVFILLCDRARQGECSNLLLFSVWKFTSAAKRSLLKMCHLKHGYEFFCFIETSCSVLEIFQFCIFNYTMIYQICDVMMSIDTWCKVHFWIYLLNHKSLIRQIWSIDRYKQGGKYFSRIFERFRSLSLTSRPFSIR